MPWLGGAATENLFGHARLLSVSDGLVLHESGDLLIGRARAGFASDALAASTQELYGRVLQACAGRHLLRIWNYVPRINEVTAELENYRAFCVGRARAFEAAFGPDFRGSLSAASAVGSAGEEIEVVFVAGRTPPRHFENPAQVPAYLYPAEHGPRSPSFARATVSEDGARQWVFISGTAAIRGHQTVAPGSIEAQLACTLENLALIGETAGVGRGLGVAPDGQRFFKVYLRNPNEYAAVRTRLEQTLVHPQDQTIYLQADICRAELMIEIEATLTGPR